MCVREREMDVSRSCLFLARMLLLTQIQGRLRDKEWLKEEAARFLAPRMRATSETVLHNLLDFIVFNWEVAAVHCEIDI